jgi:hypothetical protein
MSHRRDERGAHAEPRRPGWVDNTEWLLRHWRERWWVILLAALLFVLASMSPLVPSAAKYVLKSLAFTPSDNSQVGALPEGQTRQEIGKACDRGDIQEAMRLLFSMSPGAARAEECDRVFEYAMKNEKLNEARTAIDHCYEGKSKQQKLADIELAKLRQH